jgi:phospholipase C
MEMDAGQPRRPGRRRGRLAAVLSVLAVAAIAVTMSGSIAQAGEGRQGGGGGGTATPIKHLVVIFNENVSFDHYFGTYPYAANTDGTPFQAGEGTPGVNGLTDALLHHNPNLYNPQRLTHSQALTCDQNHGYSAEQKAFDGGKMDKFVENTSVDKCGTLYGAPGLTMDYYDGNTVTGLWNYAQHYSMSDNSYNTVFGPSTPGAVNLVSGQTHGGYAVDSVTGQKVTDSSTVVSPDKNGVGTVIGDPDPAFDDCSDNNHTATNHLLAMTGPNIGDRLNARGVTWGWFQGGFRPTGTANGYAVCGSTHKNVGGSVVTDYNPHHAPFQYYKSTSNPKHLAPSSVAAIGRTDQANHNYDLTDFWASVNGGSMPAVSYLKPSNYQDGHPGYSDPLDEQTFLVDTINKLQKSKEWDSTAVVIAYDDSDGWYDHQFSPRVNGSADPARDQASICGSTPIMGGYQDRCGYGPRTPLLVVSPYSRVNHVDHTVTDQASILRFVEDNWHTGRIGDSSFDAKSGSLAGLFNFHEPQADKLQLDPTTGAVVDNENERQSRQQ